MIRVLLSIMLLLLGLQGISQVKIHGVVMDSLHNKVMRSATVSVYLVGENKTNFVTLSDHYGRFELKELPVGQRLHAKFTYQGYQTTERSFVLSENQIIDMGRVNMQMSSTEMDTIIIVSPLRMNGDTLEFNADYFKLDSNAVAEDLFHHLPGIVIWGDGAITYNGKPVYTTLVNGKPFFGGDKNIALKNISKDAIKKVQLYDKRSKDAQMLDPFNSNYEIDIILKEGKEKLYFGNVGAGIGTEQRYDGYANFNYADRNSQASVIYAINNINKSLNSIDQALKNTSYKGAGIHSDLKSDFLIEGILDQQVIGGRYQYDFHGIKKNNKKHILQGSILNKIQNLMINDTSTTRSLAEVIEMEIPYHTGSESRIQNTNMLNGDFKYELNDIYVNRNLNLLASVNLNKSRDANEQASISQYHFINNQSQNHIQETNDVLNKKAVFNVKLDLGSYLLPKMKRRLTILEKLVYTFDFESIINESDSYRNRNVNSTNYLQPSLNRDLKRSYQTSYKNDSENMHFNISYKQLVFSNTLNFYRSFIDQKVQDFKDGQLVDNMDNSHISRFKQLYYLPQLRYTVSLYRQELFGRKSNNVNLKFNLGTRFFTTNNSSTLSYRNLSQEFTTILHQVSLEYQYLKNNKINIRSDLRYFYDEEYPSLDRINPLYDDSNPSYRYFGANSLSKTNRQNLKGTFSFMEYRENGYNLNFMGSYSKSGNTMSDSIIFSENQYQLYNINIIEPVTDYQINLSLRKSFLISTNDKFNIKSEIDISWRERFQYIDNVKQHILILSKSLDWSIFYHRRQNLQVGWKGNMIFYENKNIGDFDQYRSPKFNKSEIYRSGLTGNYNFWKKWTFETDVLGQFNRSSYIDNNAIIWNASFSYRFMKGNNLEIKLSALDILKQFNGIYYDNSTSSFTNGFRNNLSQYFILSISYFPRKFGF